MAPKQGIADGSKPGVAGTGAPNPVGFITDWLTSALGGGDSQPQSSTPATSPASIAQGATQSAAKSAGDLASLGTTPSTSPQSFISPLALQAYFQTTIAPMLQQIQSKQQGDIAQFKSAAGSKVDPRQLASMENVNNAMGAAAVAAPGLDQLMSQVNNALAMQTKAFYEEQALKAQGGAQATGNSLAQAFTQLGIKPPGQ